MTDTSASASFDRRPQNLPEPAGREYRDKNRCGESQPKRAPVYLPIPDGARPFAVQRLRRVNIPSHRLSEFLSIAEALRCLRSSLQVKKGGRYRLYDRVLAYRRQ